ncbi:MAG: biotin synthase BioB [Deltaproteobacteria bacterium]|nr:biotin synthase BioB [Deltaproteobacteria bacterium]
MRGIDTREAIAFLECSGPDIYGLLSRANAARIENRGLDVRLCGVVNAKSGSCTEDCKFCAQSEHNDSTANCYPLIDDKGMVDAARNAEQNQATRFGIVTSGLAITDEKEIATIEQAVKGINCGLGIRSCASLGKVSRETLLRLKEAGLTRYHCNLETAKSYFPQICSTRDWSEAADTVRTAIEIGLDTCCGGLFGLGESPAQRVELLHSIRELGVTSVPLNFFHPVPGNRLEHVTPLSPLECLKIVAVARLMMPDKEIRVCGGREHNLRDLQSWSLISGADGLMVGGYLTTAGRDVQDDLQMIRDAGFMVKK